MQQRETINLDKLIESWAKDKYKTERFGSIDLEYKHESTNKEMEKLNKNGPTTSPGIEIKKFHGYVASQKTIRQHTDYHSKKPIKDTCQTQKNTSNTNMKDKKIKVTCSVEDTQARSSTKSISGGISLGGSFMGEIVGQVESGYSVTHTKTHSEALIFDEETIIPNIPPSHQVKCSLSVYTALEIAEEELKIQLVGNVPVYCRSKKTLLEKKTKFVPIAQIFDELQQSRKLLLPCVIDIPNNTVMFDVTQEKKYIKFHTETSMEKPMLISGATAGINDLVKEGLLENEAKETLHTNTHKKTISLSGQATFSTEIASVMSRIHMDREGFQKMYQQSPDLAMKILDRALPEQVGTVGQNQKTLQKSLMEYLGVDIIKASENATFTSTQANHLSSMKLEEQKFSQASSNTVSSTIRETNYPTLVIYEPFVSLLKSLINEQGYSFELARPKANTIRIEMKDNKEGSYSVCITQLKNLEDHFKEGLNKNGLPSMTIENKGTKLTLSGDTEILNRAAMFLKEASGGVISEDYAQIMKSTGFFCWSERKAGIQTSTSTLDKMPEDKRTCTIQ